jgi:hypothetical protein
LIHLILSKKTQALFYNPKLFRFFSLVSVLSKVVGDICLSSPD